MDNPFKKEEISLILMRFDAYLSSENAWEHFITKKKKPKLPNVAEVKSILEEKDWSVIKSRIIEIMDTHIDYAELNPEQKKLKIDLQYHQMMIVHQTQSYLAHISSIRSYDAFRKEQPELQLPHGQQIIKIFGSWNRFKEVMGVEVYDRKKPQYTIEQLADIVERYKEHFTVEAEWNEFIKTVDEDLPTFRVITARLPIHIVQKYRKRVHYRTDKQELYQLMNEHGHVLQEGINHWNEYARTHKLPSYQTLQRKLGKEVLANIIKQ